MISVEIEEVKSFMAKLLTSDLFDGFLLCEGRLVMGSVYEFDGTLQKDFYDSDQWELIQSYRYISWKSEREKIFSLMKGKRTPVSFRFVLMLTPKRVEDFILRHHLSDKPEDIVGMYMNLTYTKDGLKCVSGVSRKTFVLDQTLEDVWDQEVKYFLKEFL